MNIHRAFGFQTQHQEGKFQKRDVSRVTCQSKPITQQC
jgi:hypothetical protein